MPVGTVTLVNIAMKNFILTGEPQSTNHIYKSHCRFGYPSVYLSAKGKNLKTDYQWQIKSQYHGKPLTIGLKLTVVLWFGSKRRQDIDNYNKLVLDAFTGLVWEDDSQIRELTIKKGYDKKNPRIEVELSTSSY